MPVNITPFLTPYTSPADWSKLHAAQANNFAEQMQGLMRLQAQKEQNRALAEQARLEREETARWHTGQLERFKRDSQIEEDEKDRKAIQEYAYEGVYGHDPAKAEALRLALLMRNIRVRPFDPGGPQSLPSAAPGGIPDDMRPPVGPGAPVGATGIPDELRPPAGPAAPPGAVGVPPELRPPVAAGGVPPTPGAPLDSGPPAPVASPQELPPEPTPPEAAPAPLLPGQPIPAVPPAQVTPQSVTGVTVSPQTPATPAAAAPPAPAAAAVAPAAPGPLLPGQPIPSTPPARAAAAPSPAPASVPTVTLPGELPDLSGSTHWMFERDGKPIVVMDVGRVQRLRDRALDRPLGAIERGTRPQDQPGQRAVNQAVSTLPVSPETAYRLAESGGRRRAELRSREERVKGMQANTARAYDLQLRRERRAERGQNYQRKKAVMSALDALRTSNKFGAESEAYKTLRDQYGVMLKNDSQRDLRSYNVAGTAVARMYDSGALNEGDIRRAMGDPSLYEQLKMFFNKQLADKVSPEQWNKMRDYIKQLMETKNNDMRESYRRVAAMRDGYPRGSPEYQAYQAWMRGQWSHADWFAEEQRNEGNEGLYDLGDEGEAGEQPSDQPDDADTGDADTAGEVPEITAAELAAMSDAEFREFAEGPPLSEEAMKDWDEEEKAGERMIRTEWEKRFGKPGAPKAPMKKGGGKAAPKPKTATELLDTDMPEN